MVITIHLRGVFKKTISRELRKEIILKDKRKENFSELDIKDREMPE